MTPKPATKRFEKLADFLTDMMENPKASKRVRLSAAMRLDDLLRRQERREDAEARRQDRERVRAAKDQEEALQREREQQATPERRTAPEAEREASAERARLNLEKILGKN